MFSVGDKVVYPMHGAGVIEAIEEKEILGDTKKYYVMNIPIGDMKVMIPLDNVDNIGLRNIISEEDICRVLTVLKDNQSVMSSNWNRRYRANMEKVKSGDIYEVAEVVRNLMIREKEKGLSTGERKMLDSARRILVSELVLVQGIVAEEAENMLAETVNGHPA